MIKNHWAKVLKKSCSKQNALADAIGVHKAVMSAVCNGTSILPMDKLFSACRVLQCEAEDIYCADLLRLVYGIGATPRQKKRGSVRIQIAPALAETVDRMVESGIYANRCEAVNAMVRHACTVYEESAHASK